jgi:hypothetical protein
LELPVVYVGLGSDADFIGRDVRGKAVFFLKSQFAYNLVADVLAHAEAYGAAAILASDLRGRRGRQCQRRGDAAGDGRVFAKVPQRPPAASPTISPPDRFSAAVQWRTQPPRRNVLGSAYEA